MNDPVVNLLSRLASVRCDPRPVGHDSWESRCPAHGGTRHNLSITRGEDGRALVCCHHNPGCDVAAITAALSLESKDLFATSNGAPGRRVKPASHAFPSREAAERVLTRDGSAIVGRWVYHAADGRESFTVVRLDRVDPATGETSKTFRPIRCGPDGWRLGDPPGLLPLFHLPEVLQAKMDGAKRILVVEGEACVESMARLGLLATTSAHGSKCAQKTDWSKLSGFEEAWIWPDFDAPGKAYAGDVARILGELPNPPLVRVLDPRVVWWADSKPEKGDDVRDWVESAPDHVDEDEVLARRMVDAFEATPVYVPVAIIELDDEHGDWPNLTLAEVPSAEPFPLDALPGPARSFVESIASSIGCPPDHAAMAVLVTAAAAIGRSVSLRLKGGYLASTALYCACVGPPSDGKSPSIRLVVDPLRRIDSRLREAHAAELDAWMESQAGRAKGDPTPRGRAPRCKRAVVDDCTTEKLAIVMGDNPRGVVKVRDELAALMAGMDMYRAAGKGADRQLFCKCWGGEPIVKDRVSDIGGVPITVPHPCLSILGGLTPGNLRILVEPRGCDDGFSDRWLVAYPEPAPVPEWRDDGVDAAAAEDWAATVERLFAVDLRELDGRATPRVVRFTDPAYRLWKARYGGHSAEMNDAAFDPALRGPWGKLREYAARLALVLSCLEHASDPTAECDSRDVDELAVDRAWRLAAYFKSMHLRVRTAARGGLPSGPTRIALDWIRSERRLDFRVSELRQARRTLTPEDAAKAMATLESLGVVRRRPDPPRGPGRPSTPTFDVHPALTRNYQPKQS